MVDKKVVAIFGSSRPHGNSTILGMNIVVGAESNGAGVKSFYLSEMNICPCTGCGICQDDLAIDCVIEDDMKLLYPEIREADAIIITSPVYWCSVAGQTKVFIDRLHTLFHAEGGNDLKGKRIAVALAYGDKDPYASGAINAIRMFEDICKYISAELVGIVYGSAINPRDIEENKTIIGKAYELGMKLVPRNDKIGTAGA